MSKSKSPSKKDGIETLRLLKRHLHKGVTIRALAVESGLSERTLYRDLATLKKAGASALVRTVRSDKGKRRTLPFNSVKNLPNNSVNYTQHGLRSNTFDMRSGNSWTLRRLA
ncbi:MAG TPA: HTH domain-containing protein [Oculatellaceae cyanobacterium]